MKQFPIAYSVKKSKVKLPLNSELFRGFIHHSDGQCSLERPYESDIFFFDNNGVLHNELSVERIIKSDGKILITIESSKIDENRIRYVPVLRETSTGRSLRNLEQLAIDTDKDDWAPIFAYSFYPKLEGSSFLGCSNEKSILFSENGGFIREADQEEKATAEKISRAQQQTSSRLKDVSFTESEVTKNIEQIHSWNAVDQDRVFVSHENGKRVLYKHTGSGFSIISEFEESIFPSQNSKLFIQPSGNLIVFTDNEDFGYGYQDGHHASISWLTYDGMKYAGFLVSNVTENHMFDMLLDISVNLYNKDTIHAGYAAAPDYYLSYGYDGTTQSIKKGSRKADPDPEVAAKKLRTFLKKAENASFKTYISVRSVWGALVLSHLGEDYSNRIEGLQISDCKALDHIAALLPEFDLDLLQFSNLNVDCREFQLYGIAARRLVLFNSQGLERVNTVNCSFKETKIKNCPKLRI